MLYGMWSVLRDVACCMVCELLYGMWAAGFKACVICGLLNGICAVVWNVGCCMVCGPLNGMWAVVCYMGC